MNDLELDAAIRAVAEEQRKTLDRHPSPDDLLGYHLGTLAGDPGEAVQEHLACCDVCAQVILDFEAFPELKASDPDREESQAEGATVLPWRGPAERVSRRAPVWAYPLAASLLFGMFALGRWTGPIPAGEAPRAGGYFADLAPSETGRRGEPVVLRVPEWADRLWMLLELGTADRHPRYEATLERAGRALWNGAVPRNADGVFAVEIPRSLLPGGAYRIRLFGASESDMEPLATYDFVIAP